MMRFQLKWGVAALILGAATPTFAADPPPAWTPPTPVWTTLPTRPASIQPPATAPAPVPAPMAAPAPASPMPMLTPAPYPAPTPAATGTPLLINVPANSVRENLSSTCNAYSTVPTVPAPTMGAPCAPGGCSTASAGPGVGLPSLGLRARLANLGGGGGACAAKLKDWLCYQPGPAVIPACMPEPYQAPPRAFFQNRTHGAGCTTGICGVPGTTGCAPTGCAPGAGLPSLGARLGAALHSGGTAGCTTCNSGGVGPNLASTLGLDGGCGPDGCAQIKHKGIGACAVPSMMAPTTGETPCQLQAVGVPLPENCVGNNVASDCLGGCDAVGSACRRGCGTSMLSRLVHRNRDCYEAGSAAPGFVPTSITPTITGYVVAKQPARYRYADPINAAGTSPSGVVPSTATPGTQIDATPQSTPTGSQPSTPGAAPTPTPTPMPATAPGGVQPMGYKAPAEARPFSRP